MVNVVIAILIPCVKVLVYDLAIIKDKGHTVYDPRNLRNADSRVRFVKDHFVSLEVVPENVKHFFKAVRSFSAASVCELCRYGESFKIK